jgi:hypothetical protein
MDSAQIGESVSPILALPIAAQYRRAAALRRWVAVLSFCVLTLCRVRLSLVAVRMRRLHTLGFRSAIKHQRVARSIHLEEPGIFRF